MKKINFISQVLAVMFFTLMVVIDFFPDIGISMSIGVIGLVIFILLSALSRQKGVPVFTSSRQEFIFKVLRGYTFFRYL
ncbi:hypothetical protein H1D32_22610 [Anaerobacillus sp. CMMVII]|uniref:hypothetical protein n=1 Tax=Anaerobacillus sp. CMMVII TaxID=2755588 RepID=UPI0021B76A03|nr:hypothetical protein [Anaerobacillus sp. CMMVII]MCT8140243.1 hypothetical protein [Anaerobacillus sp. CMMVII]